MRYKKDTNKGSYTALYMFNYNRNYRDSNKTLYSNYCSNYNYINRDTMRDNQNRCNKLKKFLSNKDIGWSYVDQEEFCKPLYNLINLRDQKIPKKYMHYKVQRDLHEHLC